MQESSGESPKPTAETESVTDVKRLGLLVDNTLREVVTDAMAEAAGRAELAAADNPRFDSQRKSNAQAAYDALKQTSTHISELRQVLRNNPEELPVDKRYNDPEQDFIVLGTDRKQDPNVPRAEQPEVKTSTGEQDEKLVMPTNEAELRMMLKTARIAGAVIGASTIINEAAQKVTLAENYKEMDEPGNPLPLQFVKEGFDAAAEASRQLGEWNRAIRENRINLATNPHTGKEILTIIPPAQPRSATPPKP